jgi:hypothetical protein
MEYYLGYPVFLWQGLITSIAILIAGLAVAFVTTFYLKRKDESTRVAGVILEKRVNAQHEILAFMENSSQKLEMRQPGAGALKELMEGHSLVLPYDPHIQYAKVFSSVKEYRVLFHAFEEIFAKQKLWLDKKVRHQMLLMQAYLAAINGSLLTFNRVPLPAGVVLTKKEMDTLSNQLIFILGTALDAEFNDLLIKLEILMVNSIYRLDLSRPKNSFFARQRENKEAKKVEDFLLKRSLMGQYLPALVTLAIHMIEAIKEIDITEQQAFDYFTDYSGQNLD